MHRRKGGWRAEHPSAVVVARPGPFGNPFSVAAADDAGYSRRGAVTAFEDWLAGNPWASGNDALEARRQVLLSRLEELRGRDLACWCRPDQECHAEVLLRLANTDKTEG
jgi:hypothetical protein